MSDLVSKSPQKRNGWNTFNIESIILVQTN